MFSIYIHDEFYESGDSAQLVESFDKLADAFGYYQSVCSSVPQSVYDDGVELVYDTDDNEDEIEEYLSDFYHDNMGVDNYIAEIAHNSNPCSIVELKSSMVWAYVELKAYDILCEIKHPDFS